MIAKLKILAYFLPILALVYVHKYGVNVLLWDEFGFVSLFKDNVDFWSFILQPHNEHIVPLGKLEYYILAKITSMNSKSLMYSIVLVLWLPYCFLVKKIETKRLLPAVLSIIVFYLAFFSPLCWENLLWGFQLLFVSAYAFAVLAILFCDSYLQTKDIKYLMIASCCCVIASLNSSHGILSWVSVFLAIIYSRQYKWGIVALLPGFLVVAFYLMAERNVPFHYTIKGQPLSQIAGYFLTFISVGIWSLKTGWIVGLLAIIITGYTIFGRKFYKNYLVTALAVLGLLIAALVTYGRCRLGIWQAYSSRYVHIQMPVYLALVIAWLNCINSKLNDAKQLNSPVAVRTDFFAVYLTCIFIITFLAVSLTSKMGPIRHSQLANDAAIARTYEIQTKEAIQSNLFPSYDYAKQQLSVLREKKLNVFSDE